MASTKAKKKRGIKFVRVLILNITFVLFGLCAVASGTYAWFNSGRTAEVETGAFSIEAPGGASFTLFYLDYFWDTSADTPVADGNYDESVNLNCGYEIERPKASFSPINYDGSGNVTPVADDPTPWDPTEIADLWPAHQLTFAIVLTSGSFSSFRLTSWTEETSEDAMATPLEGGGENELVHLAWAINLYGRAYHLVPSAESSTPGGISAAYSAYHTDRNSTTEIPDPEDPESTIEAPVCPDRFPFSQDAPVSHDSLTVVNNQEITEVAVSASSSEQTIVFFTIEFSDTSDTFYSLVSNGLYERNPLGNSNCYESLSLTGLNFSLS